MRVGSGRVQKRVTRGQLWSAGAQAYLSPPVWLRPEYPGLHPIPRTLATGHSTDDDVNGTSRTRDSYLTFSPLAALSAAGWRQQL